MITKSELLSRPISEIIPLIYDGSFEPHDLLDLVFQNIHKNESKVRAFIFLEKEEELRRQADRLKLEISKGNRHALSGIPIAVKDNTFVSGMPCTGGSLLFKDFKPQSDSFAIAKLRKEGALVLGKTNLDEMAAFGIATDNPHFGKTFNPWNFKRIAGGSSGGSGAAVSAGEAFAATGSDTGGSVRIPASFCGLCGLKPTYGRIGRTGTFEMSSSLDHLGVITASVRDAALLSFIMSGKDEEDSSTFSAPKPAAHDFSSSPDLNRILVGILANPLVQFDEGVAKSFQDSVRVLQRLGASTIELRLPHFEDISPAIFTIAFSETASYHEQWLEKSPDLYGSFLKSYLLKGRTILATEYVKAQRQKKMITTVIARELRKVDVLITPTAPSVAPGFDQEKIFILGKEYPAFEALSLNTYPFNFLGLPAITIPNGFSDGMPVGLQIIANHWQENAILKVADAFQQVTDFHRKRPDL